MIVSNVFKDYYDLDVEIKTGILETVERLLGINPV